jgi:hypothetical protein
MIWSRVTPTIVLNILILGTVSGMVPNVDAEDEVRLGAGPKPDGTHEPS